MKVNSKISDLAFKFRGLIWGIFASCILVFPTVFSWKRFVFGIVLVLAGQLVRFVAAGYIPKYRTLKIGAPVLITWGPYKWVRNPLYLGNAIMGLGWSLMAGWGWVIAFVALFFVLYTLIVIPAEEKFLVSEFGKEYEEYKKTVPALFPFPRNGFPKRSANAKPFNFKIAREEEIYSIRVNVVVTILIIVKLFMFR
ncbi:MAG: isoprenylcysteine carboxylmethyltransferase family protein [Synergistes sp.]|nr:isoprenylcysteine carboxylmethyltransferase family protein [Synergistes sp.]